MGLEVSKKYNIDEVLEEMIWIPGGTFVMGSDDHYPEEAPKHPVKIDGFWISQTPVTNRQFARFVEETGHVTLAEKSAGCAGLSGSASGNVTGGFPRFHSAGNGCRT